MSDKIPQTVRVKEELMRSLIRHVDEFGGTQQQIASFGAWFFMCLPPDLTRAIAKAYYEWCKLDVGVASLPASAPPLVCRIMRAIHAECAEEAKGRVEAEEVITDADMCGSDARVALDGKAVNPLAAAGQALDGAAHEVGGAQSRALRKPAPDAGKARKSG